VRAEWLEELIWSDVRRFLKNPGEVLERAREQLAADEEGARTSRSATRPSGDALPLSSPRRADTSSSTPRGISTRKSWKST